MFSNSLKCETNVHLQTDLSKTSPKKSDEINLLLDAKMNGFADSGIGIIEELCNTNPVTDLPQEINSMMWPLDDGRQLVEEEDNSSEKARTVDEENKSNGRSNKSKIGYNPDERIHISAFIQAYKKQPNLWLTNHLDYHNRKLRQMSYKAMIEDIRKACNIEMDMNDVLAKIKNIRCSYHKSKRTREKKIWYFNKLAFLNDAMIADKGEQSHDFDDHSDDSNSHGDDRYTMCAFITAYENQPALWDTKHPGYYKRDQRRMSVEAISKFMKQICNINMDTKCVTKKISNLRCSFARANHNLAKGKRIKLWFFEKLSFLNTQQKFAGDQGKILHEEEKNENDKTTPNPETQRNIEITSNFIESYKRRCLLWNPHHSQYLDSGQRKWSYKAIADDMFQRFNYRMTVRDVQMKVHRIRIAFNKITQRIKKNSNYIPNVWYYEKLSFLENTNTNIVCGRCDKVFLSKNAHLHHMYVKHEGSLPYVCTHCKRGYVRECNLKQHIRTAHEYGKGKISKSEESVCSKKFAHKIPYETHIRDDHRNRETNFKYRQIFCCKTCNRNFNGFGTFYQHKMVHKIITIVRNKFCGMCSQRFASRRARMCHRKLHLSRNEGQNE